MSNGYELPYENEEPRDFNDYNEDVFSSREEAEKAYEWFQENWHPKEGGYGVDDVFDRLTSWNVEYDEDGEIIDVDYDFEGS